MEIGLKLTKLSANLELLTRFLKQTIVSKWLKLNKLSLNTGKTELIFFHSKRHTLNYDDISIKFNGKKLLVGDTDGPKWEMVESFCKQVFSDNVWALKKMAVTDF